MKKLLSVSAFLLVVGVTVGSTPARAIYRPCDMYCAGQASTFVCNCPAGGPLGTQYTTCGRWTGFCNPQS
jgi:hypothetical protein